MRNKEMQKHNYVTGMWETGMLTNLVQSLIWRCCWFVGFNVRYPSDGVIHNCLRAT